MVAGSESKHSRCECEYDERESGRCVFRGWRGAFARPKERPPRHDGVVVRSRDG
jgi:hypothetical protein